MNETEPSNNETEPISRLKAFYLERDFYSNPQVLLIFAANLQEATDLLDAQLVQENCPPGHFGVLKELNINRKGITIFKPPGDSHFNR